MDELKKHKNMLDSRISIDYYIFALIGFIASCMNSTLDFFKEENEIRADTGGPHRKKKKK